MAKAKGSKKPEFIVVADKDIHIQPHIIASLCVQGVSESRVRMKVRDLLQRILDKTGLAPWSVLHDDFRHAAILKESFPDREAWQPHIVAGRIRLPEDLSGVIFHRFCPQANGNHRDKSDSDENESWQKVELGVVAERRNRATKYVVFRFIEHGKPAFDE